MRVRAASIWLLAPNVVQRLFLSPSFTVMKYAGTIDMRVARYLFSSSFIVSLKILVTTYQRKRFFSWWNGTGDDQSSSSILALSKGGFFGNGLGESNFSQGFLPAVHTDFILPIIGEELGFVGAACVVLLFVVLVIRGLSIGNSARRKGMNFHSSLAYGISIL